MIDDVSFFLMLCSALARKLCKFHYFRHVERFVIIAFE